MDLLAVSNSCFRLLCSFGPGFLPLVFCWEEARGVGRGGQSLPRVSGGSLGVKRPLSRGPDQGSTGFCDPVFELDPSPGGFVPGFP
ncbi:hypothetical protein AMTRI_Chr10g1300 [Amborella trichopoda]